MTNPGRGQNASPASNNGSVSKQQKKKSSSKQHSAKQDFSDSDVSIDLLSSNNAEWEKRLKEMEQSFQNKIDVYVSVIESKDKTISSLSEKVGKLSTEIGYLKDSYSFLSKETSDIKDKYNHEAANTQKKLNFLEEKTQDLEDRSRRTNLVVFGVPENKSSTFEDCDKVVCNILGQYGILESEDIHRGLLERAHRLGKKKTDQTRPRPIIVCCGSYKDKEYILHNANKLKGTPYIISEDFSKATLDIRRQLVNKGKEAKQKCPAVQGFQLKYKRLILKYINPKTNSTFTWSFNLKDTEGSLNWFEPPTRNRANQPRNQMSTSVDTVGYQSQP